MLTDYGAALAFATGTECTVSSAKCAKVDSLLTDLVRGLTVWSMRNVPIY